ncbi:pirin family protein [Paenibacillus polymyxa]|uniref:Pirin family protein n=1 Tax=Paenibacillus polymyxa TaxID=1406 RepID=A0AAE9L6N1_PAEPO|nr:pirin family protein [Paenibacillus polymyxa]URJ50315.1 pirin family protein [Paenibacillus polymyxa]
MIKIVTSAERHTSNKGWIHSEFSFSFADYEDPSNAHFGCMLAHNDNELEPQQGFKRHPHHDLEIVTYVIEGQLHHSDSLGHEQDLKSGSIQVLSAGTGIEHEERNTGDERPVRFLQMWFLPESPGIQPSYQVQRFKHSERLNRLQPVVSGSEVEGALSIAQDINLYLSRLEKGQQLEYPQQEERRTHIYVVNGHVEVTCQDGDFQLGPGDAARIQKSCNLKIRATGNEDISELVFVDLP